MGYEKLSRRDIELKLEQALAILNSCSLCPRKCSVNRLKDETGICRSGRKARVSSYGPHFGEEKMLVGKYGSGTIFFANCNLNCVFCQNYDISQYGEGDEVSPPELAKIMLQLQSQGCHNINLVSPTHYVPQLLEALALATEKGLKVPLVYNSGGYDSLELLQVLDWVVNIYMPDIKFGDDLAGEKYLGVKDYFTASKAAVKEMHRQVGDLVMNAAGVAQRGLLVRHLVLPNNLAGSDNILNFIANKISRETYINIMDQYYPAHLAFDYEELSRRLTRTEYNKVLAYARDLGLQHII